MTRCLLSAIGAFAVVAGGALVAVPDVSAQSGFHRATAPAPAPGTIFLFPERVPLEDGSLATVERGWMFVPVDRTDQNSHVIAVEIYRIKARQETNVPAIFRLHGGPGWPGIEGSDEQRQFYEQAMPFTDIADYVVIGQRGIGTSKPNTICQFGRRANESCREYWESRGLELQGINVVQAAGDVADVARALGYDSIIISGGSFGSHWGMAVMRFHPELVSRAVLTGMEGPNHTYDSPSGVLNGLRRLAQAAEASADLAPLIPSGGLIRALEQVRERLLASGPVRVTVADPGTGDERSMTFGAFNVPGWADGYSAGAGSRSGARTWPADILRLYYGGFEDVARVQLERAARSSGGGGYRTAAFFMLDCGSGITADRLAELRADSAKYFVGDKTMFYEASCPAWGADLGDAFRQNFDTDIPTAIVHGNWDLSTPYENALELAPHFTRGKLVTVVGGTHGALGEAIGLDDGFRQALMTFLRTGNLAALPDSVVLPPIEWVIPEDVRRLAGR